MIAKVTGSVRLKDVPTPGVLSTSMSPDSRMMSS